MLEMVPWGMTDEKGDSDAAENQKKCSFSTNCFLNWHVVTAYTVDIGLCILSACDSGDLIAETIQRAYGISSIAGDIISLLDKIMVLTLQL